MMTMIGEKAWLAYFDTSDNGTTRTVKPMVRRVRVRDRDDASATVRVEALAGGRELVASEQDVVLRRKDAVKRAEQMCQELDGKNVMGMFTYSYPRPDAVVPDVQVRMRQVSPDRFTVEVKLPGRRSFKAFRGLRRLPLWRAEKLAADIRAERDVRGHYVFDATGESKRPEFLRLDRRRANARPIRGAAE